MTSVVPSGHTRFRGSTAGGGQIASVLNGINALRDQSAHCLDFCVYYGTSQSALRHLDQNPQYAFVLHPFRRAKRGAKLRLALRLSAAAVAVGLAIALLAAGHGGDGLFAVVLVGGMGWHMVRDLGAVGEARDRQLRSFQTAVTSVDRIRTAFDRVTEILTTLCSEAEADHGRRDELRAGIDLVRQFWSPGNRIAADRWDERAGVDTSVLRSLERSSEAEVFMTTIEALNSAYRNGDALLRSEA
jgi:hypothetical protein